MQNTIRLKRLSYSRNSRDNGNLDNGEISRELSREHANRTMDMKGGTLRRDNKGIHQDWRIAGAKKFRKHKTEKRTDAICLDFYLQITAGWT